MIAYLGPGSGVGTQVSLWISGGDAMIPGGRFWTATD